MNKLIYLVVFLFIVLFIIYYYLKKKKEKTIDPPVFNSINVIVKPKVKEKLDRKNEVDKLILDNIISIIENINELKKNKGDINVINNIINQLIKLIHSNNICNDKKIVNLLKELDIVEEYKNRYGNIENIKCII